MSALRMHHLQLLHHLPSKMQASYSFESRDTKAVQIMQRQALNLVEQANSCYNAHRQWCLNLHAFAEYAITACRDTT